MSISNQCLYFRVFGVLVQPFDPLTIVRYYVEDLFNFQDNIDSSFMIILTFIAVIN